VEHPFEFTSAVAIPYFNFAVFVAAFIIFFRKSLMSLAKSRRDNFLSASKEAQASLDTARQVFKEVKTRLDALDGELRNFSEQSERAAHEEAKRVADETERFAKQLQEETKRLASEAIESARNELRHELVQAARELAQKRIETELDNRTRETILRSRISDAAKMSVQ
jgi:F0F1-type ATP synthase membrane subunit b/b'